MKMQKLNSVLIRNLNNLVPKTFRNIDGKIPTEQF